MSDGPYRTPGVIVMSPAQREFIDALVKMNQIIVINVGYRGVMRVVLDTKSGVFFGLIPGQTAEVMTPSGVVEIECERLPPVKKGPPFHDSVKCPDCEQWRDSLSAGAFVNGRAICFSCAIVLTSRPKLG